MTAYDFSERRASRPLGVPRSTLRYSVIEPKREKELIEQIKQLARKHPSTATVG